MGMKAIEYVATFQLEQAHTFEFRRLPGWVRDTLEVTVDQQNVVITAVDLFQHFRRQVRVLVIDDEEVELTWKWGLLSGDPQYIILKTKTRLLAAYGQDKALAKLPMLVGATRTDAEEIAELRLVKDKVDNERVDEVARETFPLDNRHGSDDLTVEQEISCTVSETITLTAQEQVYAGLKGTIVGVLESQITAQLSKVTGESIGQALTRKQRIELSVKAGASVIYTVVWKVKARVGTFTVAINNAETGVAYEARYGLSFEITSSPFGEEPVVSNVTPIRGAA